MTFAMYKVEHPPIQLSSWMKETSDLILREKCSITVTRIYGFKKTTFGTFPCNRQKNSVVDNKKNEVEHGISNTPLSETIQ
jgi:hypothetical protein